jgi:hypothetical protein
LNYSHSLNFNITAERLKTKIMSAPMNYRSSKGNLSTRKSPIKA